MTCNSYLTNPAPPFHPPPVEMPLSLISLLILGMLTRETWQIYRMGHAEFPDSCYLPAETL